MNSHPLPRIATLDCVRGIAILGILLLNISAFGLPKAAYLNPAYLGMPSSRDAWTWALLDLFAQAKFLAMFALLFGAGLQMLLRRGKSWIRARLSWLVLFGLAHAIFLWDGDILLAYGLIGLVCWRMIREAKETFQLLKTGVVLYLIGVAVLLLLGFVSHGEPGSFWQPGVAELQYEKFWKLQGGFEAWSSRADLLSSSLLAIGAQYGWELGGADAVRLRADAQRLAARQLFLRLLPAAGGVAAAAFGADPAAGGGAAMAGPLGLSLERFPAAGAA
jgi:Predicted membrane protein